VIVVIDTNVLLPMLSARHPFGALRTAWVQNRFTWAISNEILLEYEEIAAPRIGSAEWDAFVTALDIFGALHGNVRHVAPSFRWRLIAADPDDDKFADCAIAAEADYLITEDAHFDALKGAGHKPQPIAPAEFIARHLAP
jgi:putative PIN family toxin of toxin-antitoxin system